MEFSVSDFIKEDHDYNSDLPFYFKKDSWILHASKESLSTEGISFQNNHINSNSLHTETSSEDSAKERSSKKVMRSRKREEKTNQDLGYNNGRWKLQEFQLFLEFLRQERKRELERKELGIRVKARKKRRDFFMMMSRKIPTRTSNQCKSFEQKLMQKLERLEIDFDRYLNLSDEQIFEIKDDELRMLAGKNQPMDARAERLERLERLERPERLKRFERVERVEGRERMEPIALDMNFHRIPGFGASEKEIGMPERENFVIRREYSAMSHQQRNVRRESEFESEFKRKLQGLDLNNHSKVRELHQSLLQELERILSRKH